MVRFDSSCIDDPTMALAAWRKEEELAEEESELERGERREGEEGENDDGDELA